MKLRYELIGLFLLSLSVVSCSRCGNCADSGVNSCVNSCANSCANSCTSSCPGSYAKCNNCCPRQRICYRPVYYPGYYQGRQLHDAYYQAGYYDYFGNYHVGRWYPQYVQSGRWVHGFVGFVSDPCVSCTAYDPCETSCE